MKISNQVVLALQNYHKFAKQDEVGLVIVDESKGYYNEFFKRLGFEALKTDTYFLSKDKINRAINVVNEMVFQVSNITDLDKQMRENVERLAKKSDQQD